MKRNPSLKIEIGKQFVFNHSKHKDNKHNGMICTIQTRSDAIGLIDVSFEDGTRGAVFEDELTKIG